MEQVVDHQSISTDELLSRMKELIDEVKEIVSLPPTITRILLNCFEWDKEGLMEQYSLSDEAGAELLFEIFMSHVRSGIPFAAHRLFSRMPFPSPPRGEQRESRAEVLRLL